VHVVRVRQTSAERWLKAELHSHCSLDPIDYRVCSYSPERLISEAARLRYDVLAITCHDRDIWSRELSEYAESLGITLIPGLEVSTEGGRHVLAYNFRTGSEHLNTLAKIRERSREDTLAIAPHPYFPGRVCLRGLLEPNIDVFDAIENSGFHVTGIDFNRRARKMARKYHKPVVGNGDVHLLWQLGKTFTWIYSEPGLTPILHAVKRGRVRMQTTSLIYPEAARFWATILWRYAFPVNAAPIPGVGDLGIEQLTD
jgi:predicted metal-dependent phosphoesterase TrpH